MGICMGLVKVEGAYLLECGGRYTNISHSEWALGKYKDSLSQNEDPVFGAIPLLTKILGDYIKEQKEKFKEKKMSKLENKTQ